MTRRATIAGALAMGCAALPSTAWAAPPALIAAPVSVKAYSMQLQAHEGVSLVSFVRRAMRSIQRHDLSSYTTTFKGKSDLSSASIEGDLGPYGKVDMTFRATGPKRKVLPPGCRGRAPVTRKGVLTGTFTVRIDSNYFRKVTKTSLPAFLATRGTGYSCVPRPRTIPQTPLSLIGSNLRDETAPPAAAGDPFYSVEVRRHDDGRLTQFAFKSIVGPNTSFLLNRSISASAKPGVLTVADDLSSAQTDGISPFFGGSLLFSGPGDEYGTGQAFGALSGSFAARFDSGGPEGPPPGRAFLNRRR
jgi:hypothetical protein